MFDLEGENVEQAVKLFKLKRALNRAREHLGPDARDLGLGGQSK
jgi:hypothetical protein